MSNKNLFKAIKENLIKLGYKYPINAWNDIPSLTIDEIEQLYNNVLKTKHVWYLEIKDAHREAKSARDFLEGLFQEYRLQTLRDLIPPSYKVEPVKRLADATSKISEKMKNLNEKSITERKTRFENLLKEVDKAKEKNYLEHYIRDKKIKKKLKELKKQSKK